MQLSFDRLHFTYVSTLVIRMPGESDRAWKRRRHSAMTSHRKAERVRRREAQRRGWPFRPRPLDVIDWTQRRTPPSFDPGRITVGRIAEGAVTAKTIASGAIRPEHISSGAL